MTGDNARQLAASIVCRPAKHSRADGSLRRHRQEEVGDQLRLHGVLRLRFGPRRLGPVRLQYGVRAQMVIALRPGVRWECQAWFPRLPLYPSAKRRFRSSRPQAPLTFPMATLMFFQFVFAAITVIILAGSGARLHELQGMGSLLSGLDGPWSVLRSSVQHLGRRLARRHGRGGLLGRLRHPSCRRHVRLRRGVVGWPAPATGSRKFPGQ